MHGGPAPQVDEAIEATDENPVLLVEKKVDCHGSIEARNRVRANPGFIVQGEDVDRDVVVFLETAYIDNRGWEFHPGPVELGEILALHLLAEVIIWPSRLVCGRVESRNQTVLKTLVVLVPNIDEALLGVLIGFREFDPPSGSTDLVVGNPDPKPGYFLKNPPRPLDAGTAVEDGVNTPVSNLEEKNIEVGEAVKDLVAIVVKSSQKNDPILQPVTLQRLLLNP